MTLIEDYITKKNIIWQNLFTPHGFCKEYEKDSELKEIIDFLRTKLTFWYYKDLFSEAPFYPCWVIKNKRSADITDLTDSDVALIESASKHTKNNLILSFLYDVLGIIKKDDTLKLAAAKYFIEFAKEEMSNDERFGLLIRPLKRSFALLSQVKNHAEIMAFVNFIFTYEVLAQHKNELAIKVEIAEDIRTHYKKAQKQLLPLIETLYTKHEKADNSLHCLVHLARIIRNIYKDNKDTPNYTAWAIKHAENCCAIEVHFLEIEKELENAVENMENIKDSDRTNKLRIKKKQLSEQFHSRMNFQSVAIPLPKEVEEDSKARINALTDALQRMDGVSQFCVFCRDFIAMPKKEITKNLKQKEQGLLVHLANNIRFNDKKEVVYQSATASEKQKLEHKTYDAYNLYAMVMAQVFLIPFITNLKLDGGLESLLKEIIESNELIKKDHSVVLKHICNGLKDKKIRSSLHGLISHFENGLRCYIESKGLMPMVRMGGKDATATFAQMMNAEKFRKLIDGLIGKDLAQHIDYLACKELGANLRGKYYHNGHGDDSQFDLAEIMLFFLLIKAYCMGYK